MANTQQGHSLHLIFIKLDSEGTKSPSLFTSSREISKRSKSYSMPATKAGTVADRSTISHMRQYHQETESEDSSTKSGINQTEENNMKVSVFPERSAFIGIGVGSALMLIGLLVLLILLLRYWKIHVRACREQTKESLQLNQLENEDHAPSSWSEGQDNLAYNTTGYLEVDVEVCSHAELQKTMRENGSSCKTNKLTKAQKSRCDGETQHKYAGNDLSKPKIRQNRKQLSKDKEHVMVEYSLAVDVEKQQGTIVSFDVQTQDYDAKEYNTTFQLRQTHCTEENVYNKTGSITYRPNCDNLRACKKTSRAEMRRSRYENISSQETCLTMTEICTEPYWQDSCDLQSCKNKDEHSYQCKDTGEKNHLFEYSMAVDVNVRQEEQMSFEQAQNCNEDYNTAFQFRHTLHPEENVYDKTSTSDEGQNLYNVTSHKKDHEKMTSLPDVYDNIKRPNRFEDN